MNSGGASVVFFQCRDRSVVEEAEVEQRAETPRRMKTRGDQGSKRTRARRGAEPPIQRTKDFRGAETLQKTKAIRGAMTLKVWRALVLLCLLSALSLPLLSCVDRGDLTTLETLVAMNRPVYKGRPVSDETVAEIKKVLRQYREDIEDRIEEREELGLLYKSIALKYLEIDALKKDLAERKLQRDLPSAVPSEAVLLDEALAVGYMDRGIYREALLHLEKALEVFPDNEVLHFHAGLCAARLGKSLIGAAKTSERERWYATAEAYYRRAVEIYPAYADALYGLAILLVYELNRLEEAESLLERLITVETQNTDALFLLAYVYYSLGRLQRSIEQYELIERISNDQEKVQRARINRERVIEELGGSGGGG
jgi:tetratricopeptide (TPR) repeat protein